MSGPSKVIVLDPDPRAGRLVQLGFEREGIGIALADLAGPIAISPEVGAILVGGTDATSVDLVRRARSALQTANLDIPVIAASRGATRADLEAAGADAVLTTPTFLRDVVTACRILQGVPSQKRDHLVGNLAETTGSYTLVRAFAALGKSGVLTLIRGLRRGEVRFYKGEVTSAELGVIHGQAAFHQLLLWTDARFDFSHHEIVRRQQIPLTPDELFADAERFLEGVRDAAGGLSPATVLEQDLQRIHDLGKHIPTEVFGVLRMFDGHRVLADILEDSPYRVFETLRVAQKAVEVGLLRRVESQRPKATWRAVLAIDEWLVGNETRDAVVERTADLDTGSHPTQKPPKSRSKKSRHKRTSSPMPATKTEIDWGALVPRVIGAEVGPLSGVVPALAAHGEVEAPTRDRAREKLEALMDTDKRDRIFPTEIGLEPKVVIAGMEAEPAPSAAPNPDEPETVKSGGAKRKQKKAEKAAAEAARLEAEKRAQAAAEAARLANEQAAAAEEAREAEAKAKLAAEMARIEAERVAAEKERLDANRDADEMAGLNAQRDADEKSRLEANRGADEKSRLEASRGADEMARLDAERIAAQKVATEMAAVDAELAAEAERVAKEKIAAEMARIEADRVANEKAAVEQARIDAERAAKEKIAAEMARIDAERVARDLAIAAEKAAERAAAERAAADKAAEKAAAEKAAAERAAAERELAQSQSRVHENVERMRLDRLARDEADAKAAAEAAITANTNAVEDARAYAARVKAAAEARRLEAERERNEAVIEAAHTTSRDRKRTTDARDLVRDLVAEAVPSTASPSTAGSPTVDAGEPAFLSTPPVNPSTRDDIDAAARGLIATPNAAPPAKPRETARGLIAEPVTDAAARGLVAIPTSETARSGDTARGLVAPTVERDTDRGIIATTTAGDTDRGIAVPTRGDTERGIAVPMTGDTVRGVVPSGATTLPVRSGSSDDALTRPFVRAEALITDPVTVDEGASTSVAVSDVVTVNRTSDTAVVTATPRVLISESPAASSIASVTPAVTASSREDATPEATDDEPSDGIIRAVIATADTARVAARARAMRTPEPEHDGPPVKEATGEIGDRRVRTGIQEKIELEPSILVTDLATAHHAAAAAIAKTAATPAPGDAASASKELEVATVRRDAVAFSADEEAFFKRAESATSQVPKLESFDDLDEGYEPPTFWGRVFGKDKKKPPR